MDAEYSFHLVAKTTAGTHQSPAVRVRTHTMTDCSGIRVVYGHVEPPELLEQARAALERIGGQSTDKIESLVTTHFVCTAAGSTGAADTAYQRALQLSLPTVLPSWLLACDATKRLAPVQPHYLGTSTAARPAPAVARASNAPASVAPSGPNVSGRSASAVADADSGQATDAARTDEDTVGEAPAIEGEAVAAPVEESAGDEDTARPGSPTEPAHSDATAAAPVPQASS